jgi:hypothetical protein
VSAIEQRMRTDRMLASHHEAGHVIAFLEKGVPMGTAVISPALLSDSCSGYVSFAWHVSKIRSADDVIISLAGGEAERIYRAQFEMGEPDEGRWETDLGYARQACATGGHDFTRSRTQAHRLVARRWAEVRQIAMLLERRKRISASQARGAARAAS